MKAGTNNNSINSNNMNDNDVIKQKKINYIIHLLRSLENLKQHLENTYSEILMNDHFETFVETNPQFVNDDIDKLSEQINMFAIRAPPERMKDLHEEINEGKELLKRLYRIKQLFKDSQGGNIYLYKNTTRPISSSGVSKIV